VERTSLSGSKSLSLTLSRPTHTHQKAGHSEAAEGRRGQSIVSEATVQRQIHHTAPLRLSWDGMERWLVEMVGRDGW